MAHSYLLEIGLEEIPAHVVTPSIEQLKKRVTDFLNEERIEFTAIKPFSTPRRLTILITGLADRQADEEQEVKGPAKKIALDKEGNWSKAAIGFTRGQGVTTDDITFKELKGTEYVYVTKKTVGQSVTDVLPKIKNVVEKMTFPTMMKWATYSFKYIRPIRWIVSLLDDQVIPFSILDVTASNISQGHRFLGKPVTINNAQDYEKQLKSVFVLADATKRKQLIKDQINKIAADQNWNIEVDADLLEEVNNLVEWPTAFSGHFDEKYLEIPEEVLITSMRDHQRFFYARNKAGQLLPNFISVRNGNKDHLENVIRGNEKVLTARLEDAAFFYHEDQKHSIDYYVEKLKKVSFHDKIGSMYEKMQRVQIIAQELGKYVGLTEQELADVKRASEIYKFDLVTGMVGEFPELQGVMGEKYALLENEHPAVATAIREHYMPVSADGALPATKVGAVLAIADKFDDIGSFFAVDLIPTGSNDPYALRRQALGIVRITRDQNWHFPMQSLQKQFLQDLHDQKATFDLDFTHHATDVRDFMKDRVRQWFSNKNARYDIVEAVTKGSNSDILNMLDAAKVLETHKNDTDFKENIEALTRVLRISDKADLSSQNLIVDPSLFENESEKQLFDAVETVRKMASDRTLNENFQALQSLRPLIEAYFDQTMIMVDDKAVRENRLKQLTILARLIFSIGNLNELIVK
ncbi:glycine--tRNA ligase subunit beta [Pediococcus ethanolidurans]|uniref:Glycine--tRNA ligase beta subunit n=1 Tax=Pediococcus ethanolidurans TaxID=319653 RepID=A0A0R2K5V0_9LACO|nr:glycine--tRNA ligase subunit beta [Pediococcus ethanolidurans]KRN82556.1 glycyl-tRNA synthetase subunit beta [Pediococcus ethanolidurans]GEN94986.1 glycine--tRNA ligase beta subunit [Pediococcus ethanolidurans]SER50931.1 glycyl-tRNA synthetase beta chain [Pediococcus ethanolidurans]